MTQKRWQNYHLLPISLYTHPLRFYLQFISTQIIYHQTMDISDFKDNFKYKFVVPFFYIISWALMFVGPAFIQVQYQKICIAVLAYLCIKSTCMTLIAVAAFFKCWSILNRAEDLQKKEEWLGQSLQEQVLHAYIIPSYKEDVELLSETLDHLASHHSAKSRYMVFLGMEAHEQHSDLKAEQLVKQYRDKFRLMGYTQHHIREFEQKGKASNVSWCAEHLEEAFFKTNNINPDKVFITVIDADSWVPQIYVSEVEDHLFKEQNFAKRYKLIYQPNQIFTRNHLDVPIFTRTYDQVHSCMHHSNLISVFDASFPLSNYTLSFNLVKKIGFWDTCPDAIGQDFHMTIKSFWKTHGDIETIPIYAPFNQINIQTGKGYIADVQARFWQAERHARGVSDVAYNINMLIQQPLCWRTFTIAYQVIECFLLPAVVPWIILAMTYQSKILFRYSKASPELISQTYTNYFFTYATFCFYFSYFIYFILKRRATSVLYNLENESFLRIVEYPILFVFNMVTISIPTFVIAAFGALFEGREYTVAEKVITRKPVDGHHL